MRDNHYKRDLQSLNTARFHCQSCHLIWHCGTYGIIFLSKQQDPVSLSIRLSVKHCAFEQDSLKPVSQIFTTFAKDRRSSQRIPFFFLFFFLIFIFISVTTLGCKLWPKFLFTEGISKSTRQISIDPEWISSLEFNMVFCLAPPKGQSTILAPLLVRL